VSIIVDSESLRTRIANDLGLSVIETGISHPHGSRRSYSQQKPPLQESRLLILGKQLAKTQADLDAIRKPQASVAEIQEMKDRQQEAQHKIEKLQIINAALLERAGVIPYHLRDLIRMEAPSTLESRTLTVFGGGFGSEQDTANDNVQSLRVDWSSQVYETASGQKVRTFTTAGSTNEPFLSDVSFDDWLYLDPQLLEGRM
jgi:FtsZ-binding cell division protein ZapB